MDSGFNGGNGSGHEDTSSSQKPKKYRHKLQQIQQLNLFFQERPYPDDNQMKQLSHDLGLDAKQIKFWFQNKRTQMKSQNDHADNNTLRQENESLHFENIAMIEVLKNVTCTACGDAPLSGEERQNNIQQLKIENAFLKQEHERLSLMLANMSGKPVLHIQSLSAPSLGNLSDIPPGFVDQGFKHRHFDHKST